MRSRICVAFVLIALFSCTNHNQVPAGILGPDSMRVIMHDLILADQFVTQYLLKDSLKRDVKKESQELYEKLFAVHGTTRAEFRKSLEFYTTRPDLEKKIFDSLSGSVGKERSEIYKGKYGARDSLAKKSADSIALIRSGSPPLNPDSLKRVILQAHPGLPAGILLDSVHRRVQIQTTADSLRLANHINDSTTRHKADSLRFKKRSDSLRKVRPFVPKLPAGAAKNAK